MSVPVVLPLSPGGPRSYFLVRQLQKSGLSLTVRDAFLRGPPSYTFFLMLWPTITVPLFCVVASSISCLPISPLVSGPLGFAACVFSLAF